MFISLVAFFLTANFGWLGLVGVIATGMLLIYQHSIVKPDDLSRLNAAFFTTNAFVSVILFVTMAGDAFLSR
jgi:4-hydroxybenzoate polyprenyltransferase